MDEFDGLPGRLVVLSGASGAGKSSLAIEALSRPGLKAVRSISATTRSPRGAERDGVDYYYVTRDQFERDIAEGRFLEWAEVHGHFYGTPIRPVCERLAEGTCVVLVIDVQGALQVRERAPRALLVFVNCPNLGILERRLRDRGTDDEATIARRLANARDEIAMAGRYDEQLINDDLGRAVDAFVAILDRCRCGV